MTRLFDHVHPDQLLALCGLAWSLLAYNVYRPIRPTVTLGTLAFFAGWLTGELAVHHALLQMVVFAWLGMNGALETPLGWLGAMTTIGSAAALLRYHEHGHRAHEIGQSLLASIDAEHTVEAERVGVTHVARPFQMKDKAVHVERGHEIARIGGHVLHADVFCRADRPPNAPVLVYVHGGAWIIGYKQYQGLPILNALAKAGWVCVSVGYRLSPYATFPDHIHDVYRGVHWAKQNAARWGGDPSFTAICGNSAGGHLAALAALGSYEPALRPAELPDADLRLDACVGLYGVYDFTNRRGQWPGRGMGGFVSRLVMKKTLEEAPELYRLASPIDHVRKDAPPFLLIHGSADTLVPTDETRHFVEALRAASDAPVLYAEIPGAQHAFDIFHSVRGRYVVRTIVAFLRTKEHRKRAHEKRALEAAEQARA